MKMAMATDIRSQFTTIIAARRALLPDYFWAGSLVLLVSIVTMIWFGFDHHFPSQDEAEHIMNSLTAYELLRHCHPFSHRWWYQVLTINCYYPPFVYMVNGFISILLGPSRFTEQLAVTFFVAVMSIAVYAIVRLSSGTRAAAFMSACCLCMYPLIAQLSHSFFLDLPEVAMTATALATLLWWRSSALPNWRRTWITAIVLGLACLTKQLVAAYLLPVGLYFLLVDSGLTYPRQKPKWDWLQQILAMGIITALIGLPFLLINFKAAHEMTQLIIGDFAQKNIHWSYIDRLRLYSVSLQAIMSPVLLLVFVVSAIFVDKKRQTKLLPIVLSALGGLALMLAWPGNGIDSRYMAPALIGCATYTGIFLGQLLAANKWWQKILAMIVIILASANYIVFNFSPYPLALTKTNSQTVIGQASACPTPVNDWGHEFVISTITKIDGQKPVYLNVMTNMGTLHTHAFELLLKESENKLIRPTNTRQFTVFGDKVKFDQQQALQYHWYLWKTGSVGYIFFDKESQRNFDQLVEFVRHSGKFKLMAEKPLPDDSELMLYRRIN